MGRPRPAGPVARLFGSLATALIDLGLPTIRAWLRDRLGPNADVGQVTTDGSLVHLDGVRVPIGPRGLVSLHRATAVFTALGSAGLPEVRLHAFTGVITFGDVADNGFHADISFTASENPDEAAWIWGELLIQRAVWTAREGSPKTNPMNGRARLYVSSREWRIDGGRLDGEIVRAHFAGAGIFEQPDDDLNEDGTTPSARAAKEEPALLVPRALSSVALGLEQAKVGPFVDVAGSLGGATIAIPTFLPLDAQLDGTLSWNSEEGGKADLRIRSQVIRAHVRGGIGPFGNDLKGRIEADVVLATLLRSINAPAEAIPRDEDVASVRLDLDGSLKRPEVHGTIRASEVGFRFGRPRFVPPVVVRDLESEVFVKDDRAVVRAVALARSAKITLDADTNIRTLSLARGTVRADVIEAAFLRDVIRTMGAKIVIADDVTASLDLALAPPESEEETSNLAGTVTVATQHSKIVGVLSKKDGSITITGGVTVDDVAKTGLLSDLAVRPTAGEIVIALDVVRCANDHKKILELRGTAGTAKVTIALPKRPEVPPFEVEGVTMDVVIDPKADGSFRYSNLRFRGYGGTFFASGTIPFVQHTLLDVPRVALRLEQGGAELAETLLQLTNPKAGDPEPPFRVKQEPSEDPPPPARTKTERWIPRGLIGTGELHLFEKETSDARYVTELEVDLKLETPAATRAAIIVKLFDGSLDGSSLRGGLALADLLTTGFLDDGQNTPPVYPDGVVSVDAFVREREPGHLVVQGRLGAERLPVRIENAAGPIHVTSLMAKWRVDKNEVAWKDLEGRLYGGSFASSGSYQFGAAARVIARLAIVSTAIQELPAISGQLPAKFIHGWLSSNLLVRADAGGSFRAAGDLLLDDASIPALDLARPTLAKYGLRPPNEDAASPITALIVGTDWGLTFRDVRVDLRGAMVRGELGISRARVLDGRADVTLEEEYLRTSKVLTLPRVLTERLILPVHIDGPIASPKIDADLSKSLGHFLRDNRVAQLVESAVEEAQILLGRHPTSDEPPRERRRPAFEPELAEELRAAIDKHVTEWDEIERRSAADARFRVASPK